MATKQQQKQSTNTSARSAEENDQIRRAKKAKQKLSGGRNPKGSHGGYWESYTAEQKQRAEEARQARAQAAELRKYQFRLDQAMKAKEHSWYLQLTGVAKKYANAILDKFALATPTADRSRTQVAEDLAFGRMSSEDIARTSAMKHGSTVVRKALAYAFTELTAPVASDDEELAST